MTQLTLEKRLGYGRLQAAAWLDDRTALVATRVVCTPLTGDGGEVTVRVIIENVSDSALHIFDSWRMPYLLEQDGDLLILYGVDPPDPNMNYFMIEIPATKILPPGEQVEIQVGLTPLCLGNHYSLPRERNPAVTKHGAVIVHCEVGWGRTPILSSPEEQNVLNINQLMAWQEISRAEPVQVQFP